MRAMLAMLALALAAAPLRAEVDDETWKETLENFKDDFKKKSIAFKMSAIESLPLNDARTIEFVIKGKYKLFHSKDWFLRGTAADRLSKIRREELRKQLLSYAKDRDKRVRECVMLALALSHKKMDVPFILEGLKDPAWEVRRMAVWAAGRQRVREAVEPMISMIHWVDRNGRVLQEGETHARVHGLVLFNLEEITGKYFHTEVDQWKAYWEKNKDRTLPPVKRFDVGDFGDVKLDFNDTFARKGSGPLIITLPSTHKRTTYYMPYFNKYLFVKWLFINLPPITSFPDVQYNQHNDPIYPVDILVDAFEETRKKYGVDKAAIFAHGFTTWIAAKYAQKYPDRVSGLILLNPFASNDTFGKRIDEAKRSGDPDAEFWGKVSSYEIKASGRLQGAKLRWYSRTFHLHDKSDVEIYLLEQVWRDPDASGIAIPPFDIRGEETSRAPALMMFASKRGEKFTGIDDMNRLKRYYPKHIVWKQKKSARLPFMEDPEGFEKALRVFVDKYLN